MPSHAMEGKAVDCGDKGSTFKRMTQQEGFRGLSRKFRCRVVANRGSPGGHHGLIFQGFMPREGHEIGRPFPQKVLPKPFSPGKGKKRVRQPRTSPDRQAQECVQNKMVSTLDRLEATASRLEVTSTTRLEAVASRLEAIAISNSRD